MLRFRIGLFMSAVLRLVIDLSAVTPAAAINETGGSKALSAIRTDRMNLQGRGGPGKRTAVLACAAAFSLALIGSSSRATYASTIGNPLIPRTFVDCCSPYIFVEPGVFFPIPGEKVTSWAFYSGAVGSVTPLLLTQNGPSTFTVTGIGATVSAGLGLESFAFNLISGTDVVGTNTVLGFQQTVGSIEFDPTGGADGYLLGGVPSVGLTLSGFTLDTRAYSVEFTAVPEPPSLLLLGVSVLILAIFHRRLVRCAPHQRSGRRVERIAA